MTRVQEWFWYIESLLVITLLCALKTVQCDQQHIPVYYPNRIVFTNESRPFTIRVTRFICTETPYEVSELLQCKTVLRRNKPTFFNVILHVPKVLNVVYFQVKTYYRLNEYQAFPVDISVEACAYLRNPSEDIFSRHVMSVVFITMPDLLYYCPQGNTTYRAAFWLEDKFFPMSVPAGDYRMDIRFSDELNKTLISYQVHFSVRRRGQHIPVYYPNRIVFTNESKPFNVRVTRFICTETPYEVSELLQCKTVLRRNKPTFFNVILHVPKVLNVVYFQ
uniref:Uncharacterized protein n=1 Tax=Anopheles quadriannulatus TaxID=34691 RepID=A0A182XH60_ANOQN